MAKIVKDNSGAALKRINDLVKTRVGIGFPGDTAPHVSADGKKSVSMALLGYVHEFGSPEKNIPARPFLVPGIESIKHDIADQLVRGAKAALLGDATAADTTFHAIGLMAQAACRKKIDEGGFAPLSERTIRERAERRYKDTGKLVGNAPNRDARSFLKLKAQGVPTEVLNDAGFAKPLIDTGQLKQAINYVVLKK